MLNLLIAIIGESFGKVNDNQKQAKYQERAQIISDNWYLVPNWEIKKIRDEKNYLITAVEVLEQDDDQQKV